MLQLVEEVSEVKQPSFLGRLGQKLVSLHSVAFAPQILVNASLNCPFINPQFGSHGSHELGGLMSIMASNPFDKISVLQTFSISSSSTGSYISFIFSGETFFVLLS